MGRPGLTKHRKFIRLERLLGSHLVARGVLETLWDGCYENGEEFLGDSVDVEGLARWDGDAGKLTEALLSAGFIEEAEDHPGCYQVHDLWHHAPDYVQKRRRREVARRSKSDPCLPTSPNSADSDRSVTGQGTDKEPETADAERHTRAQSGVTPAPAPAPSTTSLRSVDPPRLQLEDIAGEEEQVLALWREIAESAGLPKVLQLDGKRRTHLKARLKEKGWLDLHREAITFAARHPEGSWMRGEGARRWMADLDHFLKPGKVLATVEKARAAGTGAARASPPATEPARRCATADAALGVQLAGMSFPELPLLAAGAP